VTQKRLQGQTALITGAAKRIGREIAVAFAEEGVNIVIHCRSSAEEAEELHGHLAAQGVNSMETDDLTLPDPQILHRPFLAIPLHELAPELTLPGLGLRIEEVVARLPQGSMKPLESYTERLRRAICHGPKY
jgi:hypothetical protein